MTQGDRKWEEMSDEEFVADLVAKHGVEAARAMAKAMNLPAPRVRHHPKAGWRVGNKPKYRNGIPRPKRGVNPSWKDREELARLEPPKEHVKRIYTRRTARYQQCAVCPRALQPGDEVALLYPSWRRVHSECVAEALAAAAGSDDSGLGRHASPSEPTGTAVAAVREPLVAGRGAEPSPAAAVP